MMTTMIDPSPNRRATLRRTKLLLCGLIAIGVLYAAVQLVARRPYEPRLFFTNESDSRIENLRVIADSRKTDLGPLDPAQSVILPVPESDKDTYTIHSWTIPAARLTSLIPIVRAEHRDIVMAVAHHGCLALEGYEIMSSGATVLWDEPE
jgi:hypothetical protein